MIAPLSTRYVCAAFMVGGLLAVPAYAEKADISKVAIPAGGQGSADKELASARKTGWTKYSSKVYNRVNNAYVDGLTDVDPAEIWTNYACVATGDTLKRLGQDDMSSVDIVMRTHLASSSVFIIKDGAMRRDPNSFTTEEMFTIVTLMQERFTAAAEADDSIIPELETSYESCAATLRAESRKIED